MKCINITVGQNVYTTTAFCIYFIYNPKKHASEGLIFYILCCDQWACSRRWTHGQLNQCISCIWTLQNALEVYTFRPTVTGFLYFVVTKFQALFSVCTLRSSTNVHAMNKSLVFDNLSKLWFLFVIICIKM